MEGLVKEREGGGGEGGRERGGEGGREGGRERERERERRREGGGEVRYKERGSDRKCRIRVVRRNRCNSVAEYHTVDQYWIIHVHRTHFRRLTKSLVEAGSASSLNTASCDTWMSRSIIVLALCGRLSWMACGGEMEGGRERREGEEGREGEKGGGGREGGREGRGRKGGREGGREGRGRKGGRERGKGGGGRGVHVGREGEEEEEVLRKRIAVTTLGSVRSLRFVYTKVRVCVKVLPLKEIVCMLPPGFSGGGSYVCISIS